MHQPLPEQQHHHPTPHHHQPVHQAVLQPLPFHSSNNQANSQWSIQQPHQVHHAPLAGSVPGSLSNAQQQQQQQQQQQYHQQQQYPGNTSFESSYPPPSYTQRDTSVMTGVMYTQAPSHQPHFPDHQPFSNISLRPLTASGHSAVTPQPPSPKDYNARRPLNISDLAHLANNGNGAADTFHHHDMWRPDADVAAIPFSALRALLRRPPGGLSPVSREPVSLAAPPAPSAVSPASASSRQLSEASTAHYAGAWAAAGGGQQRAVVPTNNKVVWAQGGHSLQQGGYAPPISALTEQALGPRTAVMPGSPPPQRSYGITDSWTQITDSWTQTPFYLQADTIDDIDDKLQESVRKVLAASGSSAAMLSSLASSGIAFKPNPKDEPSILAASRVLEETCTQLSEAQRQNRQLLDERVAMGQGFKLQVETLQGEITALRSECEVLRQEAARGREEPDEAVEVLRRVEGQLTARHGEREAQLQLVNEQLRGEVADVRGEIQAMLVREGKLSAALEAAHARAHTAEQSLASVRASVDKRLARVGELEVERDTLLSERADLMRRLHAAEASQATYAKTTEETANAWREVEAARERERESRRAAAEAEERAKAETERSLSLKEQVTALKMRLVDETRRAERAESMLESRGSALDESVEA
eukprot:CAMPEP_0114122510 /NCGR_PEP_ID=MMETSP0043_2-20121206/7734_1 /TAXON_ID=464988 /ORGANISM="Hemiselmis andersenii, Strain CCMP644" /LENGTH=648 /DNA_ID=CAMNT_0001215231 /DNA_START=72 /DNA_END=2019 /DNA_ORIENTATION=+